MLPDDGFRLQGIKLHGLKQKIAFVKFYAKSLLALKTYYIPANRKNVETIVEISAYSKIKKRRKI